MKKRKFEIKIIVEANAEGLLSDSYEACRQVSEAIQEIIDDRDRRDSVVDDSYSCEAEEIK
jgi:hypothetical protein